MARPAKREQLIEAATRLFYREGFHATGIDRVLAEAGVARMTLYNHFASKDELILAVLERRSADFRSWFAQAVGRRADTPQARLQAIFDVLDDWFHGRIAGEGFAGCTFIKAAGEYGDPADPVRRAAAAHKAALRADIAAIAAAAGAAGPQALAADLLLLVDGAIVTAQVSGDLDAARRAGRLARPLLEGIVPAAASRG